MAAAGGSRPAASCPIAAGPLSGDLRRPSASDWHNVVENGRSGDRLAPVRILFCCFARRRWTFNWGAGGFSVPASLATSLISCASAAARSAMMRSQISKAFFILGMSEACLLTQIGQYSRPFPLTLALLLRARALRSCGPEGRQSLFSLSTAPLKPRIVDRVGDGRRHDRNEAEQRPRELIVSGPESRSR